MVKDPNAQISVISGAWAVPLFKSNANFADLRKQAALLQQLEAKQIKAMRSPYAKARIRIWTMAEFIESPMEALQVVIDEIGSNPMRRLTEAPTMANLTGFGQFLQNLKNQGMNPHLMGDFPADPAPPRDTSARKPRKPYLVTRTK